MPATSPRRPAKKGGSVTKPKAAKVTSGTGGTRHQRKCHDCDNVAEHEDNITPWVNCKKCGSNDTRLVKQPPPTPPPLQPGDAVWVRAVVQEPNWHRGTVLIEVGSSVGVKVESSAIRRIEGEVKP